MKSSPPDSSRLEEVVLEFVENLNSPQYSLRAEATSRLIEIGIPAIPHIGRKAIDSDPESRQRCFQILRKLATGDSSKNSQAALAELETLSSSTNEKTMVAARHTLDQIRHGFRSLIRELGALIEKRKHASDPNSFSLNLSYAGDKDKEKIRIPFHLLQHLWKIEEVNLNLSNLDAQSISWLGLLTHLETLEMKKVDFGEGGLEFLKNLIRLKELDLSFTSFSEKDLLSFRGLKNLEICNLSKTNISSRGMKSLQGLTKLKDLNLTSTNIDDEGTAFLESCRDLKILRLKDTNISDKTLSYLGALKKLRVLSVSGTKISDKGLVHLKDLKKLQTLWISRTDVSAAGERLLLQSLPKTDIHR